MNDGYRDHNQSLSNFWLNEVRQAAPIVDGVLTTYQDLSVGQYLQQCLNFSDNSYQPREDLSRVIFDYVAPLLGEERAEQAACDIIENPVVLTTNHHGVDYFAQSTQGTLLLALAKKNYTRSSTVPVFACGNVPLDNLTYPRGALLYGDNAEGEWPQRIPVYSNKLRRQPVSKIRGIDPMMVNQSIKRLRSMPPIYSKQTAILQALLEQEYLNAEVQALSNYSDQAVLLNKRIWQRLFSPDSNIPDLVSLELEKIAERLLLKDLRNEESLTFQLLFNEQAVQSLWQRLDGITGCWHCKGLEQRWSVRSSPADLKTQSGGSFAFWGVDAKYRRIPLFPVWQDGGVILQGCDDNGESVSIPLVPEIIENKLKSGQLMPTLFTSFAVIALARGITCLGGYYQGEYLPAIQRGICDVMQDFQQSNNALSLIDEVSTTGYLSGMQAVMINHGTALLPGGVVEIMASGQISEADLKRISDMSVGDAHRASLAETVPDLFGSRALDSEGLNALAQEHFARLSDRCVLRTL